VEPEEYERALSELVREIPVKTGALYAAVTAMMLVLHVLARAWALALLWNWFIVRLGAPAVGLWTALGLTMVMNLLFASSSEQVGRAAKLAAIARLKARGWGWVLFESAVDSLLPSALIAAVGWLIHLGT